ncbi:alpha/beta fold hydrolase [Actinocorallia populi]|uniref:alpha/beta fold hydrolase n=1 Tax=Actinocorallia populi TaxID=2079200 RepID=UPI000D09572F|nr:alpha/beta hydrolase [Actinocorallia populi]
MEIILIPGFWLDGSSWDEVVPVLEEAGHRAHAVTLPGMESKGADRSGITLRDNADAVVKLIDALDPADAIVLVGHSGGGAAAQAAADARADRVARVVYVDTCPLNDGTAVNEDLPAVGGEVPLPDWSFFDDESLVDLDEGTRATFRERAIPTPVHVARDPQRLFDERRHGIPVTVIACEFPSTTLREWLRREEPMLRELAKARDLTCVDLPTGHWPQFTRPHDLAQTILSSIGPT